jgi:hypothetical protein
MWWLAAIRSTEIGSLTCSEPSPARFLSEGELKGVSRGSGWPALDNVSLCVTMNHMTDEPRDPSDPFDEAGPETGTGTGNNADTNTNSGTDEPNARETASGPPRSGDDARSQCGQRRRHRTHRAHRRHGGRKERVLHTRVSEQLSEDIRRLAEDLRVPASNLVRNVLEEVFTVVENVSDDFGELFEEIVEEADSARDRLRRRSRRHHRRSRRTRPQASDDFDDDVETELRTDEAKETGGRPGAGSEGGARPEPEAPEENPFPDVLGWQPLVLNHAVSCARCDVTLARGSRAFMGLKASGLSSITLCRACAGS